MFILKNSVIFYNIENAEKCGIMTTGHDIWKNVHSRGKVTMRRIKQALFRLLLRSVFWRNKTLSILHISIVVNYSMLNQNYADDTTLMAESEEDLKSLLMKVKEESEKVGLKLNT